MSDMGVTIAEVNRAWSFREVLEAHVVLDAADTVAEYHRAEAERKARAAAKKRRR